MLQASERNFAELFYIKIEYHKNKESEIKRQLILSPWQT
jgi:hypothetical protein